MGLLTRFIQRYTAQLQGQHHVLKCAQVRYQLKRLEHKANVFAAELGSAILAQLGKIFTYQLNQTATGSI